MYAVSEKPPVYALGIDATTTTNGTYNNYADTSALRWEAIVRITFVFGRLLLPFCEVVFRFVCRPAPNNFI